MNTFNYEHWVSPPTTYKGELEGKQLYSLSDVEKGDVYLCTKSYGMFQEGKYYEANKMNGKVLWRPGKTL